MEGIVANVFDRKEGKCDGTLMQERGVADTASAGRLVCGTSFLMAGWTDLHNQ